MQYFTDFFCLFEAIIGLWFYLWEVLYPPETPTRVTICTNFNAFNIHIQSTLHENGLKYFMNCIEEANYLATSTVLYKREVTPRPTENVFPSASITTKPTRFQILLLQSALQPFVGFGLFNYRWLFSAGRFSQSAVASGMSNPQPGGPMVRTFQLSPQGVPSVWNDAGEPQ